MNRHRLWLAALFVLGAGAVAGSGLLLSAQPPGRAAEGQPVPAPAQPGQPGQPARGGSAVETGVKLATEEYVKAFNARDAKAAAALWTADGEYVGVDGVAVRGRAAIEKSLADDFKAYPKTKIQVLVSSIRPVGRQTAMVEGVVNVEDPTGNEPGQTRYSALQVFEDGMWRAATVREWIADPEANASKKILNFLVGSWTAKGHGGTMTISYGWNGTKTFLTGNYAVVKDGKTTESGTEILTRNPNGGMRSWTFDNNGTFSSAQWQREGNRWFDESVGVLPDGAEINTTNLLIPLGPDAFSWQVIDRSADGVPLPLLPPVKVTRVKAGK